MIRRELDSGWTVTSAGGPVPAEVAERVFQATVPGVIHTDLLAAGAIPDPYDGANEGTLAWIGRSRWRYELSFDWAPNGEQRHDLACDGLDTVAAVALNGTIVARVQNQHRRYRFDIRELLVDGENRLVVEFDSALETAEAMARMLGERPRPPVFLHPFEMIRKSACNFGWDWGPDLVTAGIWRAIAVESWSGSRIESVRPSARADGSITVNVDVERERDTSPPATIECRVGGAVSTAVGDRVSVELELEDPLLWWPRGYGDQALYDLHVSTPDDSRSMKVGFRTIDIDSTPDADGTPFQLRVNGEPIFVRGANWIPDDAFPTRVDRDRYSRRIADATDANMNLLRVWGGGVFEADDFYDLCDERGVLVWQDFLFACAAYPEEEPLWGEVTAEARDVVSRLAWHPSLALWNGANENIWGHSDWGWVDVLEGRTWGERYYLELLPSIVSELDPDRPYVPNSPFSWSADHHPNDPSDGLMHIWDVWNEVDYTTYASYRPRFVSEFGFQGPPAWSTLTRAVHDEPLRVDGPELLNHQKAPDGQVRLREGYAPHFPEPGNFTDWHWTTQLNQARAVRFGIEHFRAIAPICQGAIVWQLNDCWPSVSWAAVDGDGIRKPLWHALRASYADRILVLNAAELTIANDSPEPYRGDVVLKRWTLAGECLDTEIVSVVVNARDSATIPLALSPAGDLTSVRANGFDGSLRLDREPIEFAPSPAVLATQVSESANGYIVTVKALSVVIDLCLFPDRLDPRATVSGGMVNLLPSESARFEVTCASLKDPEALVRTPVLRTANDLFSQTKHTDAHSFPVQ